MYELDQLIASFEVDAAERDARWAVEANIDRVLNNCADAAMQLEEEEAAEAECAQLCEGVVDSLIRRLEFDEWQAQYLAETSRISLELMERERERQRQRDRELGLTRARLVSDAERVWGAGWQQREPVATFKL